jgi:hypothetical protein
MAVGKSTRAATLRRFSVNLPIEPYNRIKTKIRWAASGSGASFSCTVEAVSSDHDPLRGSTV